MHLSLSLSLSLEASVQNEIPRVYKAKQSGVLVVSDNQNIHQLLHRLTHMCDRPIGILCFAQMRFSINFYLLNVYCTSFFGFSKSLFLQFKQ